MAKRRARPGSGSSRQTLRERGAAYGAADVTKHLGEVPFVIVGGLATRLYMPERMTLDVDVLVLSRDQERAERALAGSGCEKKGPLTVGDSVWRLPEGRMLDLIALDEPWVRAALREAVNSPDGQPYVGLRYLVLMKLGSGRMQDLADISRMLGGADEPTLDGVRQLVKRHRKQDLDDLESLIALGRLEWDEDAPRRQA